MSDVLKLQYGSLANMPIAKTNGQFLVAKDVEKAFVDLDGVRIPLTDVVTGNTQAQILAITSANALPKLYLSSDTLLLFYFDASANAGAGEWRQVGGAVEKATKDGDGNVITTTYQTVAQAALDHQALEAMIAEINSFEVQIVDAVANLPNPGETNVIYFVPANAIDTQGADKNVYDEYMYVLKTPAVKDPDTDEVVTPAVYAYEHIGTTETDLTNYYTKTESDALEAALYTALGFTKSETEAADFVTVSARFTADEADIAEINAKLGNMDASTTQGFESVETRLSALESDNTDATAISEIEAQLGDYPASTDNDFVSVADRFAADETNIGNNTTAITEINAKLGDMADSTDSGFASVEARLSAEETATSRFDAELGTLDSTAANYVTVADRLSSLETADNRFDAELGTLDSTAPGYVTVADRLTATEAADTELAAQLGNLDSTAQGYVSVADRLDALESDNTDATAITEIQAQLGDYPASTDNDFVSIEDRFEAEEAATARFDAELGTLDSTDPDYVTVADRLTALETDTSNADDAITELEAKFGSYPDSTDNGFVSVADRFTAVEGDVSELEAKFGSYADSTAVGFTSVADRFTADETSIGNNATAITELAAKIGVNYPASTAEGFKSIDTRLSELVTSIGNINRFDIVVIRANESLPATGALYTIYFVPVAAGADTNNGQTKYVEYMWVADTTLDAGGYYEEIGITEADLSEYYTSAQVDAIVGTDSTAGTLKYRIKTNEDDIAELKAELGSLDSTAVGYQTVAARLTAEETATSRFDAELGTLDSTAANYVTVADRLDDLESADTEFAAQLGNYLASADNNFVSIEDRFTADEADITEINAKLGNMAASTDSGFASVEARLSAIEAGALNQTQDTADAEKPILVSGNDAHNTVEYVSNVTVNASAGSVTANSIVLGGATLTFDSVNGALVVNF